VIPLRMTDPSHAFNLTINSRPTLKLNHGDTSASTRRDPSLDNSKSNLKLMEENNVLVKQQLLNEIKDVIDRLKRINIIGQIYDLTFKDPKGDFSKRTLNRHERDKNRAFNGCEETLLGITNDINRYVDEMCDLSRLSNVYQRYLEGSLTVCETDEDKAIRIEEEQLKARKALNKATKDARRAGCNYIPKNLVQHRVVYNRGDVSASTSTRPFPSASTALTGLSLAPASMVPTLPSSALRSVLSSLDSASATPAKRPLDITERKHSPTRAITEKLAGLHTDDAEDGELIDSDVEEAEHKFVKTEDDAMDQQ